MRPAHPWERRCGNAPGTHQRSDSATRGWALAWNERGHGRHALAVEGEDEDQWMVRMDERK